jgi:nicotinamidase-related amidase
MGKTALLIVDVQIKLFHMKKAIYQPERLLKNINILEERARSTDSTIVYIQHENDTTFKYNTPEWNLNKGLTPDSKDILIRKKEGNSFFETPLNEILKKKNVDRVIICGMLTNLCVQRTCLGAVELNFKTVLASDAHSNLSIHPQEIIRKTNNSLAKSGVELCITSDVVF